MLLSILILLIAIVSLLAAGLPLTWILLRLTKNDPDSENIWYISLFTGFSLIAIILKTLVAFNIPLKYTSWPLAVVIVLGFVIFILKNHDSIPKPPKAFIIGFLLVLAIQSFGYLIVGAGNYMGYNWWDNIFYVTQTQFHMDYPLNTVFDSISNQPWMAYGILAPVHRISRSMLQGFVAVLCGVNAEYTIGFISILSPVLTYCALNFAANKLIMNKYMKIAACFFAAMVPGLTSLHLEGFLGASLIVPFLIIFCVLITSIFEKPTVGNCVLCAMLLATATTTYTEATLIFVLLAAIIFIWSIFLGKIKIKKIYVPIGIFAGALLINIQFINPIFESILHYSVPAHGLDAIYDFALSSTGFTYAYLGLTGIKYFGLLAIFILLAGFLGLTIKFLENKSSVLLSFIALIVSLVMFIYSDEAFLYYYFRMLLLASPIVILGLWLFFEKIYELIKQSNLKAVLFKISAKRLCLIFLILCMLAISGVSVLGTSYNIYHTIDQQSYRAHPVGNDKINLRQELNSMQGKNIFLVSQDSSFESWWLMFHARNNSVWLCHESVDNYYVQTSRTDYSYLDYSTLPDPEDVVIVHDSTYYNAVYPETVRGRVDSYMIGNTQQILVSPGITDNSFQLVIYSKDILSGIFNVLVGIDPRINMNLSINGKSYNGVKDGDILHIPVSIGKGFTKVDINVESSSDGITKSQVNLTDWTLNIN